MKRMMKKIISFILLVTMVCGMGVSAYASEQAYTDSLEKEKEAMLEDVKRQLLEQDAMRFYPVYEQLISDMLTPVTRATKDSKAYLPDGGVIYYANYLNTGVEMMNTYYSDEAYDALINGDPMPGAFSDLVAALTVGLVSQSVAALLAVQAFLTTAEKKRIKDAGGAYLSVTKDHEGYARAILAWKGHPYVTYTSGAKVTKF